MIAAFESEITVCYRSFLIDMSQNKLQYMLTIEIIDNVFC